MSIAFDFLGGGSYTVSENNNNRTIKMMHQFLRMIQVTLLFSSFTLCDGAALLRTAAAAGKVGRNLSPSIFQAVRSIPAMRLSTVREGGCRRKRTA